MPSKLFLLLKSPLEWSGSSIMASLSGDDERAVVLLNDAVLFALGGEHLDALSSICPTIYAMRDDIDARGLKPSERVETIDYGRLVELIMEEYDQTITV